MSDAPEPDDELDEDELPPQPHPGHLGLEYRPGFPKYDWPMIRAYYVEGYLDGEKQVWPSLADTAEHFNASVTTVKVRSSEEGWRDKRAQWQAQVERERQALKAHKIAKDADELDTSAVKVAKVGIGLVHARLVEIAASADGNRRKGERTGISGRELEELARAADLMHRIGLRGLGDPNAQRLEVSGSIDISTELRRDDPDRLVAVLSVLHAAGLDLGIEGADSEGEGARYPEAIEVGR